MQFILYQYLLDKYAVEIHMKEDEVDPERDAAEIYSLIAFSEKENSILKRHLRLRKCGIPQRMAG